MQKSASPYFHQSRLVRKLSTLDASDTKETPACFSERFGSLMDLSGSIALAATLDTLPSLALNSNEISSNDIKADFLKERSAIVSAVIKSFVPAVGYAGEKLPTPLEYHAHCKMTGILSVSGSRSVFDYETAYEPYRKFYVNRQGEISTKVRQLQARISQSISSLSPELAQLSKLDLKVCNVLAGWSGSLFGKIPKLLGKRFAQELDANWCHLPDKPVASDFEKLMKSDGWIGQFCFEMREMLLAELNIRMQPILGMIDTLPKSTLPKNISDKSTI